MKSLSTFISFILAFSILAEEACKVQLTRIDNDLKGRTRQRSEIDNLLKDEKFDEINDLIVKSHKNAHAVDGTIDGFSVQRDIIKTKLQRINTKGYVSSYFQYYEKFQDTFGVIDTLLYKESPKFKDALKDAEHWIDSYKEYFKTLKSKINEGVEAKMQKNAINEYLKKNRVDHKSFMGTKNISIELPYIVNGEIVKKTKVFTEMSNFKTYVKNMSDKVDSIFSRNIYDDMRFNSELHGVMIEHEMMRRRINFLRDSLSDLPSETLSLDQLKLLKDSEKLIADQSLMSRSDVISYVQKKEIRSEIRAFFKSAASKKKGRQRYKYGQTESFSEKIRGQAIEGTAQRLNNLTMAKLFKYTIGISLTGSVATLVFLPVTENARYNQFRSSITNWWSNQTLEIVGTTPTLTECAKSDRTWEVEEVCFNEFLFEHLSYYFYKSQADPSYDYTKDPEFLKKRENLTRIYLEKRDFKGNGQFHASNKDYLTHIGYRAYLDDAFLVLAVAERDNNFEVQELLEEIIEADYIHEDNIQVSILLDKLLLITDKDFVFKVKTYLEQAHLGVDKIKAHGKNVKGEHLNEFMKNLTDLEYKKENLKNRDDENNNLNNTEIRH